MSDSNYDVYVIKMLEVAYDATIDQTARFDGLYKGMIWPYNHGDVPCKALAWRIHSCHTGSQSKYRHDFC
ncbi:hypothetical protein PCE01_11150 [Pediococcus cellicola]|nr:hypothetical protein PCE01_11150 [Pediococcus cellicola]